MLNQKIAAVGTRQSILPFMSIGVELFACENIDETQETVLKLSKQDYALILIDESMAEEISEIINKNRAKIYPIILPIPNASGTLNLSMRGLKYNMEKAIGMDVFFNKDESKDI